MQGGTGGDTWLNAGSGLSRQWFTIADQAAPAAIERRAGITVGRDRAAPLGLRFQLAATVDAQQPLSAVEVRCHIFDPFGSLVRSLSVLRLLDVSTQMMVTAEWNVLTVREAAETFASACYVMRARTQAGKVYTIDRPALLTLIRRVGIGVGEAELDVREMPLAK